MGSRKERVLLPPRAKAIGPRQRTPGPSPLLERYLALLTAVMISQKNNQFEKKKKQVDRLH
jgi:hypothetical protein